MTEPNNCEICFVCYTLTEDGDGDLSGGGGCSHRFCGACLEGVSKTDFLYCPLCKTDWTAYFYEKYPNNMRVHSEEESSDEDDELNPIEIEEHEYSEDELNIIHDRPPYTQSLVNPNIFYQAARLEEAIINGLFHTRIQLDIKASAVIAETTTRFRRKDFETVAINIEKLDGFIKYGDLVRAIEEQYRPQDPNLINQEIYIEDFMLTNTNMILLKHSEINPLHNGLRFNFCIEDTELSDIFSEEENVLLRRDLSCYCFDTELEWRERFENVYVNVFARKDENGIRIPITYGDLFKGIDSITKVCNHIFIEDIEKDETEDGVVFYQIQAGS